MRHGKGPTVKNEIFGNAHQGIGIRTGAAHVVRANVVKGNKQAGICIYDGCLGKIHNDDLRGNIGSGLQIESTAGASRARDNKQYRFDDCCRRCRRLL
ncbi:right-handed parallel beta-helix repeat-containing protein [Fertoebacter nigrum]|uniref:Right-handed parallel beta-helix repeat-containing protein n=1 Tax=Fertoeibacter niger TaxID=2656921 RepID=A0A8X8KMT9_9RHOB|nr:right-handed parallel beta-helix repeat-containing protein [Fertoeibacter niger]